MKVWSQFSVASSAALLPWLGRLATLVMLCLLAWLCSTIFWTLSAPETQRPTTTMQTDAQQVVQALVPRHLFGIAAPLGAEANPSMVNFHLIGTIAAQKAGQVAYALLATPGKPSQVVREGAEIMPGVTVRRVLSRQVELLVNGQSQMLNLPISDKGVTMQRTATPTQLIQAVQPQTLPEPVQPAQRRGNRIRSSEDES